MHSNIHLQIARANAALRWQDATRLHQPRPHRHPPPLRGRAARVTARLARRLDADAARRAIA